jgi:hypothetical protein
MSPTIASTSLPRVSALRARLGAAACLLAAAGARSASAQPSDSLAAPPPDSLAAPASDAPAAPDAASPRWQFDGAGLLYGEKGRVSVIEPQARITRLFPDGQTFSATLGLDVITGASPTGAIPTASVQTTTTPSGNLATLSANQVPTQRFSDSRGGLDLEWSRPFGGWLTPTLGTHVSIEKDYRSLGGTAKLSIALMRKLTTLTLGAGYNEDRVDPTGGTRAPLSDASVLIGTGPNAKRVRSALAGISRILTRRWLIGVTGSRSTEHGYLTDPYKVISVLDSSGTPVGLLTDSRPSSRTRKDVLASSVYHLTRDILYASYRYYWDDWGVTSHTADARYRLELTDRTYVQPHVRYYFQGRANFFQFGLPQGAPLPAYATSDSRLGDLRTLTLGATYGFHPAGGPGELSLRAEYIRQWGRGSGGTESGEFEDEEGPAPVSGPVDFIPPVDIGAIVVGYSIPF